MAHTFTVEISPVDAQRKAIQQQKFVRESLTRAFSELNDAQSSKRELPDASDLFKLMDDENVKELKFNQKQ